MRPIVLTGLSTAALVLAGCQAAPGDTRLGQVAPPMALDERVDSTWEYLAGKYDTNGDGRITPREYRREGGRFDRLDRDGDGALTAADWEREPGRMAEMMRGMRAQRLVAVYFQAGDPGVLALAELEQSAAAYDDDGDGRIGPEEFETHAERRRVEPPASDSPMMRRAMEGVEPWAALAAAVDDDADGLIASTELVAFFKSRDDGDLVWTLDESRRGARAGGGASSRPMSGPAEGTIAPDFALRPPDGGETVTLSSFRKNLPVALIFGSYT